MGRKAGGFCQVGRWMRSVLTHKALRKHGGLNKISHDALAEHNHEAHSRWIRKYHLEKEALKATQNQLSLQLGWHDVEREWLLGQVECLLLGAA